MPLYYTEGNEGLYRQVDALLDEIEKRMGVSWSPHARVLVFNSLAAIQEDPSPVWAADREERDIRFRGMVERLPQLAVEIAVTESVEQRLTYYQVLHWLSGHLDGLCPFEKRPVAEEERRGELA